MKFVHNRPYSDPKKAARKIVEIANSAEPGQEGRIYLELTNGPFLYREKGTSDEYKAGLDLAIERGWLFCTRVAPSSGSRKAAPKRPEIVSLSPTVDVP